MMNIYYRNQYKTSEQDYDRASLWVANEVASSGADFADFEIVDSKEDQ